ncbi:MAG: hypothetical protein R2942_19135 [Ignavibacteria bacterium]
MILCLWRVNVVSKKVIPTTANFQYSLTSSRSSPDDVFDRIVIEKKNDMPVITVGLLPDRALTRLFQTHRCKKGCKQ